MLRDVAYQPVACCTPKCLVVQRRLWQRVEQPTSLNLIQLTSSIPNPPHRTHHPRFNGLSRKSQKIHKFILVLSKQFCTQLVSNAPEGRKRTVADINGLHNNKTFPPHSRWQNPSDQNQSEALGRKSVKTEFMLPRTLLGSSDYTQRSTLSLVLRNLSSMGFWKTQKTLMEMRRFRKGRRLVGVNLDSLKHEHPPSLA